MQYHDRNAEKKNNTGVRYTVITEPTPNTPYQRSLTCRHQGRRYADNQSNQITYILQHIRTLT